MFIADGWPDFSPQRVKRGLDPDDGKAHKDLNETESRLENKMQKMICAYDDNTNATMKVFGDYAEIYADVDMQLEECDYGVYGSPVWTEVSDYDIDRIYVNEDAYTLKQFKAKYSEAVVDEVLGYISDAVDKVELD